MTMLIKIQYSVPPPACDSPALHKEKLLLKKYEILYILEIQKRIVSAETIRGNTVNKHNQYLTQF